MKNLLLGLGLFLTFWLNAQTEELIGYWVPCYTADSCPEKKYTAYVAFTEDQMQSAIFMSGPDKDPSKFGAVGRFVLEKNIMVVTSEKDKQIDRYEYVLEGNRLTLTYLPARTKIYFRRAELVK